MVEARVHVATDAAALLNPERSNEDRALYGLLHLAMALSHAKIGQEGEAWRAWDVADRTATALPDGWTHPWLIFGRCMVDAYAVTMLADLMKPTEAVRQADQLHLRQMGSATRRSFHLIETARAFYLQREPVATVSLLRKAETEAPETVQYNLFTRAAVNELAEHGGTTVRDDARDLMGSLGLSPV
ncbi:hypothetical protein [Haloechinothrix sp. LS1_15]|uniref:hypothetical protein n=1 Tax=Haloechinothrix sp. LS1_15 TaxID=2652248 RepID=UPI00294B2ADD|nr:hypothetical protein [Haloechinothrix sp. LS1_15]